MQEDIVNWGELSAVTYLNFEVHSIRLWLSSGESPLSVIAAPPTLPGHHLQANPANLQVYDVVKVRGSEDARSRTSQYRDFNVLALSQEPFPLHSSGLVDGRLGRCTNP